MPVYESEHVDYNASLIHKHPSHKIRCNRNYLKDPEMATKLPRTSEFQCQLLVSWHQIVVPKCCKYKQHKLKVNLNHKVQVLILNRILTLCNTDLKLNTINTGQKTIRMKLTCTDQNESSNHNMRNKITHLLPQGNTEYNYYTQFQCKTDHNTPLERNVDQIMSNTRSNVDALFKVT